jgi:phosphoribosylaminoimidazole-succinocarboxamide synthase
MLKFFSLASDEVISEKVLHFQGKNKDLNQLSQQIFQQLKAEGYKTQSTTNPMGIIIQAKKAGILRDIIDADRAFTILIAGQPNDFTIRVGIGKWIQNLAVAVVEAVLTSMLFLVVDVPEMLWTREVEKGIIKEITQIVG